MQFKVSVFLACIQLMLVSCSSVGPREAKVDAISYGDVIQQAQSEQLLRNIVHRAYGEPPAYVKITSITSSYTLSSTIGATPTWTHVNETGVSTITSSLGLTPGVTFSDSPTISYVPVDDSSIVTQLEQPITFSQMALLMNNGTRFMQFMLDVGFLSMGDLYNGFNTNDRGIVDDEPSSLTGYMTFANTVHAMMIRGTVKTSMANFSDDLSLWMHFRKNAVQSHDAILIKRLLNVPVNSVDIMFLAQTIKPVKKVDDHTYQVKCAIDTDNDNLISVRMRSISSSIDFLSHAVRAPESDIKANFVAQDKDLEGKPYDFAQILDKVLIVYSSETEPTDAYVKTFMHHHWFYIKMSETKSKYTFNMLLKLMTLALGYNNNSHTTQTVPVITIPSGGAR